MSEQYIEHDEWNLGLPKLPKAPLIKLSPIYGIRPFDGVRNPGHRSSRSQHVWFTFRTPASGTELKIGICESMGEFGAGLQAIVHEKTWDVAFQPYTVRYWSEENKRLQSYTHDVLITWRNGHRRMLFVRNSESLTKPQTWRDIQAIDEANRREKVCDDMIVVDASQISRQRRDNLFRLWRALKTPNAEVDEIVLAAAENCHGLWFMKDIFPLVPLPYAHVFDACYRLVGQGRLCANLENLLWENSRVWLPK